MFKTYPVDILKLVINILPLEDSLNFMSLNKELNELKKTYNYPNVICVVGPFKNFIESFPNFKYISICNKSDFIDDDFLLCNHIQKIYIRSCDMSLVTSNGLSNFNSLIKLKLYKIKGLIDDHFKNLINLEELAVSFNHDITPNGITQLKNLKKITCVECNGITSCDNFDKLKNLTDVSFYHCSIKDNDLINLKNIKELSLINCWFIHGEGFKYLLNIEILNIYENIIFDHFFDDLILLKNLKKISICNYGSTTYDSISRERKNQLKEILGDKFNTNY